MTRWQELLKRCDDLMNTVNNAPNETSKSEIEILQESIGILKRALNTMMSNEERQSLQFSISRNLRKIMELTKETDELMESAIKLEAMVKKLSNQPTQNFPKNSDV